MSASISGESGEVTTCQLKSTHDRNHQRRDLEPARCAHTARSVWATSYSPNVRLAGLFQPAAIAVAVSLEHQPQTVEGEVVVVVPHGVQIGQHQRGGVPGGDHGDVVAAEPLDVLSHPRHQPVDQTGEA